MPSLNQTQEIDGDFGCLRKVFLGELPLQSKSTEVLSEFEAEG